VGMVQPAHSTMPGLSHHRHHPSSCFPPLWNCLGSVKCVGGKKEIKMGEKGKEGEK